MNTNFRRLKMLVLGTMAGDTLKEQHQFFLEDFDDILHLFWFVQRKSALCRTLGLETAIEHFTSSFVGPYLSLHSDFVCISVVLGVAPQLPKLWQIDSGSTGKQKTF